MKALDPKAETPNSSHPGSGKGEASPNSSGTPSKRKAIDWEAIELAYRAGVKTLRDIGADHGVSHTAIKKRAEKEGWSRDLNAKIRAKADALVSKDAVSKEVSTETKASEQEVIEANAALQAQVRREQRTDIQRARNLTMKLLGELEATTNNVELFRQLGEIMAKPDDKGNADKMAEIYQKVTSLSGRTGNMKSLAESLRVLVALEREAFGIDDRPKPPAPKQTSTDLSQLDDDELLQYEHLVRKAQVPM